ncbi:DUF2779 domain-containing protein [candidate division KSB1 bacterium]
MYRLSKSQYLRGLQCQKSLWLYKHKPEEREEPDRFQQAVFDTGTDVGILARSLFPGGELIEFSYKKIKENIEKTRTLIDSGVKTIYEASFIYDDVLVMVDILHKLEKGWGIYEVKSSTGVKEVNINDAAIQYYVLKGSGLDISGISIVHLNNQYIRSGDLDLSQLFVVENVTELAIYRQNQIKSQLQEFQHVLNEDEPGIDIGSHCSTPYPCDFNSYCWKHIPENSVFDLGGLRSDKKFEYYSQGIIRFEDITDLETVSEKHKIQITAELHDTEFVNKKNIQEFLDQLKVPIGFMDFETFQEAVPSFDGQRPYQNIPFQFSFDIVENGKTKHEEYLGKSEEDPRDGFIEKLIRYSAKCTSIVVYNKTFEINILRGLTAMFPGHEQAINEIIDKIVDLMVIFRKRDYYSKHMKGGYSIKNVLPALIPEQSYSNLGISDGMMAMHEYIRLKTLKDEREKEQIMRNLKEYCALDTEAMIKIVNKLEDITKD